MTPGRIAIALMLSGLSFVPAQAETIQVTIDKLVFAPAEVKAKVGDTIEWVNKDALVHTATATNNDWAVNIAPSQSGSVVLKKPGAVDYFCKFHPNMKGRLIRFALDEVRYRKHKCQHEGLGDGVSSPRRRCGSCRKKRDCSRVVPPIGRIRQKMCRARCLVCPFQCDLTRSPGRKAGASAFGAMLRQKICPLLAQSGHWLMRCTCPLSGVKRTSPATDAYRVGPLLVKGRCLFRRIECYFSATVRPAYRVPV